MADTISFINDRGLVETVDIYTGQTIAIQSSKEDLLKSKQERMTQVVMPDGSLVWIERGVSIDSFVPRKKWVYSDVIIDIICTKVLDGRSLGDICNEPGMPPYHVLAQWRRKFPECDEKIKLARSDYAEILREQVLAEAMAADKDTAQEAKLRMDALKWAAGVDNPDRYGNKTKVNVEGSIATQLIVDTGIRRPEDMLTQAKPVDEVIDGKHQDQTHALVSPANSSSSGHTAEAIDIGASSSGGANSSSVE